MLIMRELTGGLYFGARKTEEVNGVMTATDTLTYSERRDPQNRNQVHLTLR